MATYRYLTYDLLSGEVLADLPFYDVSYSCVLNRAGSFSGTLPLFGVDQLSISTLEAGRHGLVVERDGAIVWNGIVWTVDCDVVAHTVRVSGEGTWSFFRRRLLRSTTTDRYVDQEFQVLGLTGPYYYDTDPLLIAQELVQYAQSASIFGTNANIQVQVGGERSARVVETYEPADYTYPVIAQEVETLASSWDRGFDFDIVAYWSGRKIAKRFRCGAPHLGDSTDKVYELGRNITTMSVSWDGTQLAGFVIGSGDGSGVSQAVQFYTTPGYTYPLYDTTASWSNLDDDVRLAWLTIARANKRKLPLPLPKITTNDIVDPEIHDRIPGDEVTVRAQYGYIDVDGRYRILGYDVSPGNDGNATIKIDLAPTELFDE